MADKKVSDLPSLNGADVDPADLLYIVDSSAGAAGSKKITVGQYQLAPVSGGTANGVVYLDGSKVATSGSALVFDGTNLGLGVTPSAWGGGFKALEMSNGSVSINANGPYINQNAIYDTAWKYKANGLAAQYQQIAGQHQWATAPSGTAGNTITFTQAMTLDASGNLGVGTTSPQRQIETYVAAGGNALQARSSAVTIDAGINSSNDGGFLYTRTNHFLAFGTNNTERARITSGGDLLVGTTTSAARMTVEGAALVAKFKRTSSGGIAQFQNGSDAGFGIDLLNVAGTSAGSIYWTATTTTYATSSDRRLKENVVAAPSASAAIDAIQIVSYDWKAAPNEPHTTYGVVAQDLHTVAPEAVSVGDDGDTVEKPWGVDYSKLVPMLIKEIQSLRARVAALEAK